MMTLVFSAMIILSVVFAILTGRVDEVSTAAINDSSKAVELLLIIVGNLCMWNGLMKVADKSGITQKVSRLLSPLLKLLFKGMDLGSEAAKAISMNISANMLGLGNAATPLGLKAMQELEKDCKTPGVASNHMIVFVVLNTSSLQLIPTTLSILRLKFGSTTPMDIVPAIILCSCISLFSGIFMAKLLSTFRPEGQNIKRNKPKATSLIDRK